jgi:type I restriction enzyme S subunit
MRQKYSSFKDSGVEWIGEIPSHWIKRRVKQVGTMYGGLTGKSGDDFRRDENDPSNKPFIPFTNICNNTYIRGDQLKLVSIGEKDNQNKVKQFDLFFMMTSETQEDVGKTSVLREDLGELYLNTFCKGLRITDDSVNPLFLNYLFNGKVYREIISIEGNGYTRINLRQDRISDLIFFLPHLYEQQQIVTYLDQKTSQIDTLVSLTEKKIELLKEKRTSLINEVVTKGLDRTVKMKDSGVEWIGEIPEGWEKKKLKNFIDPHRKITYGIVQPGESDPSGRYMVRGQDYSKGWVKQNLVFRVSNIIEEPYKRARLKTNDIVFTIVGAGVGNTAVVPEIFDGANITQTTARISPSNHTNFKFLFFLLNSQMCDFQLGMSIRGAAQPGLTLNDLSNFFFVCPPLQEQQQIVDYIEYHTNEIDKLISIEQRRITTLKEYRQSLISEVVTGKVKVSNS